MQHREEVTVSALKHLRELIPPRAEDWCRIDYVVNFDFPPEGILALEATEQADLIVMGVHAQSATQLSASRLVRSPTKWLAMRNARC